MFHRLMLFEVRLLLVLWENATLCWWQASVFIIILSIAVVTAGSTSIFTRKY
jgi:hypothetical protein